MRAIRQRRYGAPHDVFELIDAPKPSPGDDEVLVRIHAASVNPYDAYFVLGTPRFLRLLVGLRAPKKTTPGLDVAGEVEAVGPNVTTFKEGDAVFGFCTSGSFAEYGCTTASQLARKPAEVSYEQAASLGVAGLTALQAVRDAAQARRGQRLLVNGAAGGVGTFAVQIAKAFGAKVTAVCSTRNVELVRSLGADRVIDYTGGDFTRSGERYDAILVLAGTHSFADYRRLLAPNGIAIAIGGGDAHQYGRHIARLLFDTARSRFLSQKLKPFLARRRERRSRRAGATRRRRQSHAGHRAPLPARGSCRCRRPRADAPRSRQSRRLHALRRVKRRQSRGRQETRATALTAVPPDINHSLFSIEGGDDAQGNT